MADLSQGFDYSADGMDPPDWNDLSASFEDLNLYQTWEYGQVHYGRTRMSHLVLRKERTPVAIAQLRIFRVPILGTGVAYLRWGPLWSLRGGANDTEVLRQALRALRNEYVIRRGLMLRLFPVLFQGEDPTAARILHEEGYRKQARKGGKRTLILDLEPSESELRKNLNQKWRNGLNQAERNQLEVIEGTEDALFDRFMSLYRDLLERKRFEEPNDITKFRAVQRNLSEGRKMRVFLCRSKDGVGSGAIVSFLGQTALYLFGATNEIGMANKASYLVQWKIIQWLKKVGCRFYDLNGINPAKNPGTYHFKAGIAGKSGRDVFFLGQYDSYSGLRGHIVSKWGDLVFSSIRKMIGRPSL